MTNELWLNLPSKDLAAAKKFYTSIGFPINQVPGDPQNMISLLVGNKHIVVNLFDEATFRSFSGNAVPDESTTEVFLNLGAESREEVDAFAQKVINAGGTLIGGPGEKDGWMYGCGFADPDGHRWGILFMDMSKMGKG